VRLVLASANPGKLLELQTLFAPLGLEIVAQGTLGIGEAEEPHATFLENALAKARQAARAAGAAAIADDSGLCVDALGGAPGVASAHFAPLEALPVGDAPVDAAPGGHREAQRRRQDAANNALLLERLCGAASRRARFVSVLIAVRHGDDPEPLVAVGRWAGDVLQAPRGQGGFGYDPLLFVPALGRTVAELEPTLKNRHSHRAQAARRMLALIRASWLR
jgi:XTP/dITP diphosphohydrolase